VSRGAVDIGTNTVRLLIRDGEVELERRILIVGLGVGVDATGVLAPEAMERAAVVLAEYGALLDRHGAVQRRAVATSACRDAANSEEFLDRVATLIGVRPEVIPGEEEAVLSFRGATGAVPGGGSTLVIDPGGGSTEFVYGTDSVEYARSIDIGSVRLNDRMPAGRPASAAVVGAARAAVREELAAVRLPGIPQRIIGVGGTYTSLAAIHLGCAVRPGTGARRKDERRRPRWDDRTLRRAYPGADRHHPRDGSEAGPGDALRRHHRRRVGPPRRPGSDRVGVRLVGCIMS
jgi:exopolyphosphatase/guanosine-5'-triphosphate,3'-diphosphate pyrophosphatase